MSLKVLLNNSNLYKHLVDKVNDKQKEKKDRENLILISRFWDFNAKFNKDKNNNFTHKKKHFQVKIHLNITFLLKLHIILDI